MNEISSGTADDSTELLEKHLAPFAMRSNLARGRRYDEAATGGRGPWQIDRERLIRSAAYRRLSHKMQVFTGVLGDYHRTRLTHTLEVVVVARAIGRALRLNEDLIEALALVHDLGHPPFGHAGEAVLDHCLRDAGGFCHNAHALRVVEQLERCGPLFPGLNLTWEVLDGQRSRVDKHVAALLEAQTVDAADSIAYDTHDADDALKLGLLNLEELCELQLWKRARERVVRDYANIDDDQLRRAILQELADWQIADVIGATRQRLQAAQLGAAQGPEQAVLLVQPTDELAELKIELERFLYDRVYRHPRVLAMRQDAEAILEAIFEFFWSAPERMPEQFYSRIESQGLARCVGDYLAGMTDRYAEEQYRRFVLRGGGFRRSASPGARRTG